MTGILLGAGLSGVVITFVRALGSLGLACLARKTGYFSRGSFRSRALGLSLSWGSGSPDTPGEKGSN
jgi:hypothetical protein